MLPAPCLGITSPLVCLASMHASAEPQPSTRPKLLLVPQLTELEWLIKPLLEEWAEVATYDVPGVGGEPSAGDFGPEVIAKRGLAELDRRGWHRCVLVADEFGAAAATCLASHRPEAIQAVALGHARLSTSMKGDAAPLNPEVFSACASLVRHDTKTFVRQLFKMTGGEQMQGGYGEELVESYLSRVPVDLLAQTWESRSEVGDSIGRVLRELDVPLFLAKHEGCLLFTAGGYEAAVAAFPNARTMTLADKPSVSPDFAAALRTFCAEVDSPPAPG
jgi:pimeloyl-ACP methyl ester carboxylesterase